MNKIKLAMISLAVLVGVAVLSPIFDAGAAAPKDQIISGAGQTGTSDGQTLEARVATITGILLFVVGAVSVIMIIVGGIKYVTSNGDASKVKSAKDTVMYSVAGVVVALLAYAIVSFVLRQF